MALWNSDAEMFSLMRRQLYTAVVGDILDQMGYVHQFLPSRIMPMRDDMIVAGRAMTVLEADTVQGDAQGRSEQMRREFVANVSHELRTPITSVKSYAETLEGEPDMPQEVRQKFLGVILNESDRMTKIVQDLLTLSRFDAGSIEFSFDYFSFEKSVRDVYNATLMEAQAHGHEFSLELEIPLPKIYGDKARVEQVLMNMVSNAIKYTKNGGRISMTAGWKDSEVWCTVKDNGIGIPQEDTAKVFDRFYRVDKARSRESGGTGLGLSIAQEIVVRHGGRIDLQSRLGKGTRITVWLPVEGPADA